MHFVWFYVPTSDDGLELRHSMRSVRHHFRGEHAFTVLGDRPSWYRGHHIQFDRVPPNRKERVERAPFRDTQAKIIHAVNHDDIAEEFCWIADDVYFLREITVEDLKIPRFDPWFRRSTGREWQRLICATFDACLARGWPALQYGTHLPHVFEKTKMRQCFDEFDYTNSMLLFEIMYGNRWRENAEVYSPFLTRLQRPEPVRSLEARAAGSSVLNYTSECWNIVMRRWITGRFTVPTEYEG